MASKSKKRPIKISKELRDILEKCAAEVAKWEPWQRSLDPLGEKGSYDWA